MRILSGVLILTQKTASYYTRRLKSYVSECFSRLLTMKSVHWLYHPIEWKHWWSPLPVNEHPRKNDETVSTMLVRFSQASNREFIVLLPNTWTCMVILVWWYLHCPHSIKPTLIGNNWRIIQFWFCCVTFNSMFAISRKLCAQALCRGKIRWHTPYRK